MTPTWYSLIKFLTSQLTVQFRSHSLVGKNTTKEFILDYSRYSVTKSNSLALLWGQLTFSAPPPHFGLKRKSWKTNRQRKGCIWGSFSWVICLLSVCPTHRVAALEQRRIGTWRKRMKFWMKPRLWTGEYLKDLVLSVSNSSKGKFVFRSILHHLLDKDAREFLLFWVHASPIYLLQRGAPEFMHG